MCNNEIPGLKEEKSELKKGIVQTNLFQKICTTQEKKEEHIKTYLVNFKLAVELKNGQLFIPSIVSDKNEVKSNHNSKFMQYFYFFQVKNFKIFNTSIEVLVTFPKQISVGNFEKLLVALKQENRVTFHNIFCQKIGKTFNYSFDVN